MSKDNLVYIDALTNGGGVNTGAKINGVGPKEQNLTPNCQVGSVGFAKLAIDPNQIKHDVRIANDWHKNIKR